MNDDTLEWDLIQSTEHRSWKKYEKRAKYELEVLKNENLYLIYNKLATFTSTTDSLGIVSDIIIWTPTLSGTQAVGQDPQRCHTMHLKGHDLISWTGRQKKKIHLFYFLLLTNWILLPPGNRKKCFKLKGSHAKRVVIDPNTQKKPDSEVHHLDRISSMSHYFKAQKKTASVFGAESKNWGLWRVNWF